MLKRVCIGIALLTVVGCGGGDGDTTGSQAPERQRFVLASGDSKTTHGKEGEEIDIIASSAWTGTTFASAEGMSCHGRTTSIENGFTMRIGYGGITGCLFQYKFADGGTGQLVVLVP